jgi:hypothetical protein
MLDSTTRLKDFANKAKNIFIISNQRRYQGLSRVLPSFLIVGAQKAGTTSLYYYLQQHPQILAASSTEVHYFDYKFHQGTWVYQSYFPTQQEIEEKQEQLNQKVITGESSPYYLFHPCVPRRITRLLPDIKIIILLRDPVARTYSHYQHQVRKGRESLSFADAIRQESNRLQGEREKLLKFEKYCSYNHAHFSYVARSLYLNQIQAYYQHFKPENILILASEAFFADPQASYSKVIDFLGLNPFSITDKTPKNVGQYRQKSIPLEAELRRYYYPHNQQLYDYLQRDFGWE